MGDCAQHLPAAQLLASARGCCAAVVQVSTPCGGALCESSCGGEAAQPHKVLLEMLHPADKVEAPILGEDIYLDHLWPYMKGLCAKRAAGVHIEDEVAQKPRPVVAFRTGPGSAAQRLARCLACRIIIGSIE